MGRRVSAAIDDDDPSAVADRPGGNRNSSEVSKAVAEILSVVDGIKSCNLVAI
jgi:hypothetical protein